MRISIDARYIRERPSGIGAYVRALVDRVPSLLPGSSFHLWAAPGVGSLSRAPNVDQTVARAGANSLATLLWPSRLAPLGDVDVLHAPFNILGRGVRCRTVVTVHDLMWVLDPAICEGLSLATPFQYAFYRDGILRALREATRIVAISEATAGSIRRFAPEASGRVRVIVHGVEPRFRPPEDRAAARQRASRIVGGPYPYFLVVGQNAPYKNHAGIVDALARASLPKETRLVLLQRLYAGGELERAAERLGVRDRVVWPSTLGDEDALALMQSATALVQYSRMEGFGMPVAEAMAAGAPVIASAIAPLTEVLGGAGLTVSLRPDDLARAMERVASEPALRDELRERGLERARALSWDRSAAQHAEVYREAAGA